MCDALRQEEEPERSPHAKALYALARRTGVAALKRRWSYSEEEAMDVVHDVLATRFQMVVDAELPRAFFLTILVRQAIDRYRRRRPNEEEELAPERVGAASWSQGAALELAEVMTFLRNELSPRDFSVFGARCVGASSKEVGDAMGLSSANVDQIVSRARARLKELLDADSE